jgi:His/Glu/Gln/Arg/opine family amino acid ABC transporter permease subunit
VSGFLQLLGEAPSLLAGAVLLTIVGSIVAGVLAMVFAIPTAFARRSHVPLFRSLGTFYVESIRGTPLLLQLLVWYYGVRLLLLFVFNLNIDTVVLNLLTALNSNSLFPYDTGVSSLFFGIFGLAFNYGAYLAEVIRGGIDSVDPGQLEAAHALGLSGVQTARFVMLPQALRIMIPPLTNNYITLIQDTAFFQVLGIPELSLRMQDLVQNTSSLSQRWEWYGIELAIYFVLCYTIAHVSRRLEVRVAPTVAGAH